jgi:tetratricopeptide (TPR) repeat protein
MTDFTSVQIPAPKDWQAFERHARLLFEQWLGDPGTQNNGRTGQPQHGVDIFGKRGGGGGPQVGVQCKGKDAEYGGAVTPAELRREVEKTKDFRPDLREFFLITTAPDDGRIQEEARLLEEEVRASGRDLSIAVWGWGRVQQEIVKYPQTLRAFHPDATPFTGEILDQQRELRRLVEGQGAEVREALGELRQALAQTARAPVLATDTPSVGDAFDKQLNDEIDGYRDLIRETKPRTALTLLQRLKERVWDSASPRIRFRILANIGAAYHLLGELETAADFLLQAAPLNPEEPTSIANKIAALLIQNRDAEAHALAVEAIAKHPEKPELALQRIQALGPHETVEIVWPTLAASVRENIDLIVHRAMALRDEGSPQWRQVIAEAHTHHPSDERLGAIQAEATLETILKNDPGAVGLSGEGLPTVTDLTNAANILEHAWRSSVGQETPPHFALAHNAALLRSILTDSAKAADLLDETIKLGSEIEETKRLRISLFRSQGKLDDAIRVADSLPDSNQSRIIRADLRSESDPEAARSILAERSAFIERRDIVAAGLTVLESYIAEGKFDEAVSEAQRLADALPNDAHTSLAMYRAKSARGDSDAEPFLDCAVTLVTPETDFPTRFLVCEALKPVSRYDDIVALLSGFTARSYDSPALRELIAASVNSDRRHSLKELLDALPTELLEKPFYRRATIAHAMRTGDIAKAEEGIRAYLALRPRDLEMHLQLMHALFRQDKLVELRLEARRPASEFDGQPEDIMKLAQFKDNFGDWQEAHDLAYRTLLANHAMPAVNMGYIAVFVGPGHSKGLEVSPATVKENMAVHITRDDGATTTYVIEPDPALRPTADYLAPAHKVSALLVGKSVGDEIVLPDATVAKIVWIKPKVLHALHAITENFQILFPEAEGFERVRIKTGSPGGLEPMLQRVRERHDAIESVARLYDNGTLPLALVGRALGADPVDTFLGLIEGGRNIKVCEGTHAEREAALAAITSNNRKGCVVDPITFHIMRRIGIEDAVAAVCGPIAVTDRTPLRIQQKIYELEQRLDENDMSVFWRDGQYYRDEVTPDRKRAALDVLRGDRNWLAANATVLPAQGRKDLGLEWREITGRFGRQFLDEFRAAQSSGRLVICEDFLLRALCQREFGVAATWLQPVLMRALDEGKMTRKAYIRALAGFIDSRMGFISISGIILGQIVTGTQGHALPPEFVKLASQLGGKTADIGSHLKAAFDAIGTTWPDNDLSWTVRQAVVGMLLENMIRERPADHVTVIVSTFYRFGRDVIDDPRFRQYLLNWLRGHFIDLQDLLAAAPARASTNGSRKKKRRR